MVREILAEFTDLLRDLGPFWLVWNQGRDS